ncbi:MAG: hypothetical protein ACRDL7_06480, partial [Gaiellaceae bacterium]
DEFTIMPPVQRNPRTGRQRRRPPHFTTYHRRASALYARDALNSNRVQALIEHKRRRKTLLFLLLAHAIANNLDPTTVVLPLVVIIQSVRRRLKDLIRLDDSIMDMTLEEELSAVARVCNLFRRIDDFQTDDQAKNLTNFTKDQLRELLAKFGLPVWVAFYYGVTNRRRYIFRSEELLIYMLLFMKMGVNKVKLESMMGKEARRYGYGYSWLVHYLDERYRHVIGPNGIRRWIDQFPEFAEVIRKKVVAD